MRSIPLGVHFNQGRKLDLRKVGRDIDELPTNTRRHGYKRRMRKRTLKIVPEQNYAPSEVAAILNVGYYTAPRLTQKMKSMVDLGSPTRR